MLVVLCVHLVLVVVFVHLVLVVVCVHLVLVVVCTPSAGCDVCMYVLVATALPI